MRWLERIVRSAFGKRELITDVRDYAKTHFGPDYTQVKSQVVRGFRPVNMADFDSGSHCSLSSATAVLSFWGAKRTESGAPIHPGIPTNQLYLFTRLRDLALRRRFFIPGLGTFPWTMGWLMRGALQGCRMPGKVANRIYLWPSPHIGRTLLAELDAGRPVIMSLSHNQYFAHTVTAYGYAIFSPREPGVSRETPAPSGREVVLIQVNDNWSLQPRWVDATHLGSWRDSFLTLTTVEPH